MKVLTYSDCESVMGKYDTQQHSKVVFINQLLKSIPGVSFGFSSSDDRLTVPSAPESFTHAGVLVGDTSCGHLWPSILNRRNEFGSSLSFSSLVLGMVCLKIYFVYNNV